MIAFKGPVSHGFRESRQPLSPQPSTDRLAIACNLAETLAFAAIGGLTLGLLGVPAGFLSGSILMVAAA